MTCPSLSLSLSLSPSSLSPTLSSLPLSVSLSLPPPLSPSLSLPLPPFPPPSLFFERPGRGFTTKQFWLYIYTGRKVPQAVNSVLNDPTLTDFSWGQRATLIILPNLKEVIVGNPAGGLYGGTTREPVLTTKHIDKLTVHAQFAVINC